MKQVLGSLAAVDCKTESPANLPQLELLMLLPYMMYMMYHCLAAVPESVNGLYQGAVSRSRSVSGRVVDGRSRMPPPANKVCEVQHKSMHLQAEGM